MRVVICIQDDNPAYPGRMCLAPEVMSLSEAEAKIDAVIKQAKAEGPSEIMPLCRSIQNRLVMLGFEFPAVGSTPETVDWE